MPCVKDPASQSKICYAIVMCRAALLTVSIIDTRLMPGRMKGWVAAVAGNPAQQRAVVRAQASARACLQLYQESCADQAPGVHVSCKHCNILQPTQWAWTWPLSFEHISSGQVDNSRTSADREGNIVCQRSPASTNKLPVMVQAIGDWTCICRIVRTSHSIYFPIWHFGRRMYAITAACCSQTCLMHAC